ncbi:MAG: radical SAM protein [Chloroflexota bacterium]
MKVFAVTGSSEIATVYMADLGDERMIEFVEALQPPYSRDERWILMVSTLFGCPVKCRMCDAGGHYKGKPTAEQILMQTDYMVRRWYPDGKVPATKFKIQFARMGEPAFNMAVLEALEALPGRYDAPGLMPSVSTIAPNGTDAFFERLIDVKDRLYPTGRLQFQFSIHTTDSTLRDELIPVKKWSFERMAAYGERYFRSGDRKITLNFALAAGMPAEPAVLLRYFDPERYLIKITPVNPTWHAMKNRLASSIDPQDPQSGKVIAQAMSDAGYDVILSIGEVKENQIGSNCGQYVLKYIQEGVVVSDGYTYQVEPIAD